MPPKMSGKKIVVSTKSMTKSTANTVHPGVNSVHPGVNSVDPGVNTVDPGVNTADPGANTVPTQQSPVERTTGVRSINYINILKKSDISTLRHTSIVQISIQLLHTIYDLIIYIMLSPFCRVWHFADIYVYLYSVCQIIHILWYLAVNHTIACVTSNIYVLSVVTYGRPLGMSHNFYEVTIKWIAKEASLCFILWPRNHFSQDVMVWFPIVTLKSFTINTHVESKSKMFILKAVGLDTLTIGFGYEIHLLYIYVYIIQ